MKWLWRITAYPLRRLALIAYDDKHPHREVAMQWYIVVVGLYVFIDLVITWSLFVWAWWPFGVTWLAINVWAAAQWLTIIHSQQSKGQNSAMPESTTTVITTKSHPEVQLVQSCADDKMVVAAMLVSTQGDESLEQLYQDAGATGGRINFLMKNRHGTPFEHNMFTFYVQAGIFVFREFHRHRIGWSYNEESGRYKQLRPVFYVPGPLRPLVQVGKPGAYEMVPGTDLMHAMVVDELCAQYEAAYATYERLLDAGVAKEIARLVLPVGINSSMYATCNARSLMAFLSLRTDDPMAKIPSKPQYEIEQVARQLEIEFARLMPTTYTAFVNNGRQAP